MSQREQEIRQAAIRLFHERGYHATSMQDIANAVGLQKGSLYHYLGSKEALLRDIVEETIGDYIARLRPIVEAPWSGPEDTARDRLVRAVEVHVEALCAQTAMMNVLLRESRALDGAWRQPVRDASRRYIDLFARLVQAGIDRGEFRRLDVFAVTMAILGACNWMTSWYHPGRRLGPGEIASAFNELFLRGLLA